MQHAEGVSSLVVLSMFGGEVIFVWKIHRDGEAYEEFEHQFMAFAFEVLDLLHMRMPEWRQRGLGLGKGEGAGRATEPHRSFVVPVPVLKGTGVPDTF